MPVPSKFARVEDASPEAITRLLDRLDTLLQHLPSTLPFKDSTESGFRTFINFQLDKAQVAMNPSQTMTRTKTTTILMMMTHIAVDPEIDLKSQALLDMISSTALVKEASQQPQVPAPSSGASGNGFNDADWDDMDF
ncbi:hypothetical protein HGRIS_002625 [Hohenbuehelia grisea]|uniref:Uncharacterized protein n=1 Tax=Hohenbuehelia grisea TaxID=104357 RepID=A0ABR3JKZ7_9AGAR